MTPTAFREAANRAAAVATLPLRVQVFLAAAWAEGALNVLLEAHPDHLKPLHDLDAVVLWALEPSDVNAARIATLTGRDADERHYLFGTAPLRAAGAVHAAVRAAHDAITFGECASAVAECGKLSLSGLPSRNYAALNAGWLRLFTTCRQAIGPTVPFDPEWRTQTALALAQGIVRDRAPDRMPILADALRDAGCGAEEALAHLSGDCTFADWTVWKLLRLDEV